MKTIKKLKSVLPFLILVIIISCTSKTEVKEEAPAMTEEWVDLFNGQDLSGWYTWMRQPEPSSIVEGMEKDEEGKYIDVLGKNNDPLKVFGVVEEDGEKSIRISGEVFGILVTEREFENYHLRLQFKWGEKKYAPRENEKRDSGILYNSIGPEGAWGGVWMKSLECQVQEGDCGDYISVDTVMVDIPAVRMEDERYYYTPGVEMMTFSPERSYCDHIDEDYEKPNGEWNTIEVYSVDGNSIHIVNGNVNNRVYNARYLENGQEVPLTKGKIQLQSEGAELFYRNVQIRQIEVIPEDLM